MPVSIKQSPFTIVTAPPALRVAQARVLAVLLPTSPTDLPIDWPSMTAQWLARFIGVSIKSDYVRRALRGLPEGSSSGEAHDGLLKKMCAESFEVDVEGLVEVHYRITPLGIHAITAYLSGNKLPNLRDADLCTNKRYKQSEIPDIPC